MSVVNGKNVVLHINNKIVACVRSCVLNTSTSFIETTTVGDGKDATFKPQKNSATASAEGIEYLAEIGKLTINDLLYYKNSHDLLSASMESLDESGNTARITFNFYISSISKSGSVGDFSTFQMEMQITGAIGILGVGYLPSNITWTAVRNLETGLQDITFTFTPAPMGSFLEFSFSSFGTTYLSPFIVPNASPVVIHDYTLGQYFVKIKSPNRDGEITLLDVGAA